ncbi:DUF2515 family protein [Bacillus carboniphilus]|uniref:DUF2515 family protein n=1 Tax=Bacillus carboniphilus TaxID=86663 RepID=A0ABY9JV93_9BACI|nr:DUF2515 family protein [Bacillus carboniphilus]WLR43329.1 DUF2515 family protein [Bacillus carboniphilus]
MASNKSYLSLREQEHLLSLLKKQKKMIPEIITTYEKKLLINIKKKTLQKNKDNLSRTSAYFDFYNNHKEIHWSFLAHLVSRNGGYAMCDLKTKWIENILTNRQQEHFFSFLEAANSWIFQDAYPQLLLYEESKRIKRPLFFLLNQLSCSPLRKHHLGALLDLS